MPESPSREQDQAAALRAHRAAPIALQCLMLFLMLAAEAGIAAPAVERGGPCIKDEWLNEPKAFIAEVTKTSVPDVCVRTVGQHRLNSAIASGAYSSREEAAAAFLPASAEIYLAEDLDFTEAVARSYLVHELVHAQQYARGAPRAGQCVGLLEGEAYTLQARYLRRHGLQSDAFLFQVIGMLQSACGIDY